MDQNEQKSVWIKLLLPICLGIFAAAIYHNAIKTQKVTAVGYAAKKTIEAGKKIGSEEDWSKFFESKPLILHKDTHNSIKSTYDIKEVTFPIEIDVDLSPGDMISKTSFESIK